MPSAFTAFGHGWQKACGKNAKPRFCRRCGIRHEPCPDCGKIVHDRSWPFCPHESIDRKAGDGHFQQPIVVQVDAKGNVRFPGRADAKCPPGFHRKELRSIREVEQFERHMNTKLSSEASRHYEREEQRFSEVQAKLRSDLRQAMQRMSPAGRAFAEFAIAYNNKRKRKSSELGFRCDILHFDQSNREAYRDADTGWRARRD